MLITKLLLFILFLSIIDIIKELFYFCMCFRYGKEYKINNTRTILLWVSTAYILTIIFKGL